MTRAALKATPGILVIALLSLFNPAALSAQASATIKLSATVVAPQTVAPQTWTAELAESVAELMHNGEQVTVQDMDRTDLEDAGAVVSLDAVQRLDLTVSVAQQDVSGQRTVRVTLTYAGN